MLTFSITAGLMKYTCCLIKLPSCQSVTELILLMIESPDNVIIHTDTMHIIQLPIYTESFWNDDKCDYLLAYNLIYAHLICSELLLSI